MVSFVFFLPSALISAIEYDASCDTSHVLNGLLSEHDATTRLQTT